MRHMDKEVLWDKYEQMKELMGAEHLMDELMRALSADEMKENLEYIDRHHELGVF